MQLQARLALLTVLLLSVVVMAQTPAQNPCAMAESNLAAARLEASTCAARLGSLEKELAETKGQLGETSNRLGVEQQNSAKAQSNYEGAEKRAKGLQSEKDALIAERDKLAQKIKRANKAPGCKWFHIGCIGER